MKKIVLALFIAVSLVFVSGCGQKNIAGEYKLIEIIDGKTTISAELLKSTGYEYKLTVKKDKTAVLKIGDNKQKIKYDKKYFYFTSGKVPYSYEDGKLMIRDSTTTMTFEKK